MARFKEWLARKIQVLTGKLAKRAENIQKTPSLPSLAQDSAPTKRYEAASFKEPVHLPRAVLRWGSQEVPLQPGFLVGRGASCHLRLPDPKASRVHASFSLTAGGWIIQDNASKNGTFLNGRRIERSLLKPGDAIRIGQTVLTYEER